MKSAAEKFIELASPNEKGESNWITYSEWEKVGLKHDNGSQWCQTDRGVGKKYTFEKQYSIINGRRRVSAIRLTGLKKNKCDANYHDHSITPNIRKACIARDKCCVFTGCTTNLECDHKNGRYPKSASNLTVEDVQTVCKAVNDMKRTKCNNCIKMNKRFDASTIHYPKGWTQGNEYYDETLGCLGCYLYDPIQFRKDLYR